MKKLLFVLMTVFFICAISGSLAYAAAVNVDDGDTLVFSAANTYTFIGANGSTLGVLGMAEGDAGGAMTVDPAAAGASTGVINATATTDNTGISIGAIGASGKSLVNLNLEGAGTVTLSGTSYVTEANFGAGAAAGTLNLASGVSYNGAIDGTGATDLRGNLTLAGGVQGVSGAVGTDNDQRLNVLSAGATGATSTFTGAVYAKTISVAGSGSIVLNGGADTGAAGVVAYGASTGTVQIGAGQALTSAMTTTGGTAGVGTLSFAGAGTQTGQIGTATNVLKQIAISTATTAAFAGTADIFTASTAATDGLYFTDDGTVTFANQRDFTGQIVTDDATPIGTITSSGTNIFTGQVGTSTNALKRINGGEDGFTTTFANDVFAKDVYVTGTGTVAFSDDITVTGTGPGAGLSFRAAGDGTVTVADGHSITGVVTTLTDDAGILSFTGATSVTGTIGTSALALESITFNGATTLGANIAADLTTVANGNIARKPTWRPARRIPHRQAQ